MKDFTNKPDTSALSDAAFENKFMDLPSVDSTELGVNGGDALVDGTAVELPDSTTPKQSKARGKGMDVQGGNDPFQDFFKNAWNNLQKALQATGNPLNVSGKDMKSVDDYSVLSQRLKENGVDVYKLQKTGDLERLMEGKKTLNVYTVTKKATDEFGKVIVTSAEAKLEGRFNDEGVFSLYQHQVQKSLNLENPFYGHTWTEEQRNSFLQTGHAGEPIEIDYQGTKKTVLVSWDKDTNLLVSANTAKIILYPDFCGHVLTSEDKEALLSGKKIAANDFVKKEKVLPDGSVKPSCLYSATLQYNAATRKFDFKLPDIKEMYVTKLKGKELSEEQSKMLNNKGVVYIENMIDKKGDLFSCYVRRNPDTTAANLFQFSKDSSFPNANKQFVPMNHHRVQVSANNQGYAPKELEKAVRQGEAIKPNQTVKEQAQKVDKKTSIKPKFKGKRM